MNVDHGTLNVSKTSSPLTLELDAMKTFPAGNLNFGVVLRQFTEAAMLRYLGRPGIDELLKKIREEGYFDQGVSVYVNDAATGRDYLRFDCFEVEPHYHYQQNMHGQQDAGVEIVMEIQRIKGFADSILVNGQWHQIPYDAAANGDMRAWVVDRLRHRLAPMLRAAKLDAVAEAMDPVACAQAIDAFEPYLYATATVPDTAAARDH